jgi:hypothetical protein
VTAVVTLFETRASFDMAALFVTWVAVLMLLLVVGNLHIRLQRLEQANPAPRPGRPYGHLIGRRMGELLGEVPLGQQLRLLLFVSSGCRSCVPVLRELASASWTAPIAVAWTDSLPSPPPELPPSTILLEEGPRIGAELGIRVTPFVLVADREGRIVRASPINSLRSPGGVGEALAHLQPRFSHDKRLKEVAP